MTRLGPQPADLSMFESVEAGVNTCISPRQAVRSAAGVSVPRGWRRGLPEFADPRPQKPHQDARLMPQPPAPLLPCEGEHLMICKRTFLGFQSCSCARCNARLMRPLTTAYRVTYWVVGTLFAFALLQSVPLIAQAVTTSAAASAYMLWKLWFPILFVSGAFTALWRDARLRAAAPSAPGLQQSGRVSE